MNTSSAFFFQQFSIKQDQCAMKIGIDGVLLGAWAKIHDPKQILDIGTGTGLLSLMMAQRSDAKIDAVEIESKAFAQAKENIKNSIFHDRIECFNTSIQNFETNKEYDLIISNPPYFEASLKSEDEARNKARHTDSLSLDDLFSKASLLLKAEGHFCIILPYSNLKAAKKVSLNHDLHLVKVTEIKGREHKSPNRVLLAFNKEKKDTLTTQLTVYSSEGGYTKEFKALTQDFYLPSIFR